MVFELQFDLHYPYTIENYYYRPYVEIMNGFIYILSNPLYEGLLKIGQTSRDACIRRKQLSTTGVPDEFVLEYQALVSDFRRQEKYIHRKLSKVRHSNKKEFFETSVSEAITAIREQCGNKIKYEESSHITPEKLKKSEAEKAAARRNKEKLAARRNKEKLAARRNKEKLAARRNKEAKPINERREWAKLLKKSNLAETPNDDKLIKERRDWARLLKKNNSNT